MKTEQCSMLDSAIMYGRYIPSLFLGLSLLMTSGCYADVESFAEGSAKFYCKRLKRCNRGQFDDLYNSDMGECRDEVTEDLIDTADLLEAGPWEYDQDAGQECIAAQRDLQRECDSDADEDIADACSDVLWDGI